MINKGDCIGKSGLLGTNISKTASGWNLFSGMKRIGVFLLPFGLDDSSPSFCPQQENEFVGSHLYTWVERGTVRAKCHVLT